MMPPYLESQYFQGFHDFGFQTWVYALRKEENEPLVTCARPGDYLLHLKGIPGPRTLVRGNNVSADALRVAGALTVRYSKARKNEKVSVLVRQIGRDGMQELQLERSEIKELVAAASR